MIICEAQGCLSNQNKKVDGKDIAFYPFPGDDAQREQWLKHCQTKNNIDKDKQLHLCELHFEKLSFTDSKELRPNAIPTIFDKVEEIQRKRKAEPILQTEPSIIPPLKQEKLDEDSHSLVTPPQSPFKQLIDNVERINGEQKIDIHDHEVSINGTTLLKSHLYRELEMGKKIYRLTIKIDKICGKPCPRSKKLLILAKSREAKQIFPNNSNDFEEKDQSDPRLGTKIVCSKGGCKLRNSVFESKPAFQCEHCDKYYVSKKGEHQEQKTNYCTTCHTNFPTPQSLYLHIKKHLICDMCQTECTSTVAYDKHLRLHVSTDPLYPYKCHQCTEIFELKEDVRQHYLIIHPTIKLQNTILQVTASPVPQLTPQKDHRCISCNITFRNEQAYRNHVNSHKKKEGLRCNISETNNIFPVPSPLTGSQIGILRAVKFSCRVCSMQFDNVGEVDRHTRTHLEDVDDEHKCNICKKLFKSSAQLNEHLKNHLSRAHPCPVCLKAFINRTTLKIHLKTHGET